jgi:hypothetical protein
MKQFLILGTIVLATGCGQQPSRDSRQPTQDSLQSFSVNEPPPPEPAPTAPPARYQAPPPVAVELPRIEAPTAAREQGARAPDVSPTAAPGVAFNYRYAFRLPGQRVSEVQERHARACEQLGVSRCRITGMRYRVVNDRDVEAMLAFKVDPRLARRFGQVGTELVTRSEGMLFDSEISGTDVGTSIRAAGRSIAEMSEDLERLEARLRQRGLSAGERMELDDEAQQLRRSIRAARADRADQQESLATTPVVFQYASGDLVPSFDTRPSVRRSAERAWDNLLEGLGIIVIILVTLVPWAVLGLILWWLSRPLRRRLRLAESWRPEAAPAAV